MITAVEYSPNHPIHLACYRSERETIEALEREEAELRRLSLDGKATDAQRTRLKAISCKVAAILDRIDRRHHPQKQECYQTDIRILTY